MTTPFWCLLVTIFLPYILSGIAGYLKVREFGSLDNKYPRAQTAQLTGLGARVSAAQLNAWEALPVFSAAVLVAHASGADPDASATASLIFVVARVLHAVFYAANLDVLRSLIFFVGIGACIRLFLLAAQA